RLRSAVRQSLPKNLGADGEPPLPVHPVTLSSLLYGILPFGPPYAFRQATERAVDSAADLRWGPDRKGFRRLVHPNGICLTGGWQIPEDPGYSGYFRNGSRALIVGRYSTCCRETRRGHLRSLSMVGKLFPTVDPSHVAPLRTASFMTQQDIGGDYNDYINDVELLNAPNTTALRRGLGMPLLMVVGIVFKLVDNKPSIRQLYQIAELGKAQGEATRAPTFMRLTVALAQPRIEGAGLDFRDEIMAQIYDRGDARPKRTLTFNIQVTDRHACERTKGALTSRDLNGRHEVSFWPISDPIGATTASFPPKNAVTSVIYELAALTRRRGWQISHAFPQNAAERLPTAGCALRGVGRLVNWSRGSSGEVGVRRFAMVLVALLMAGGPAVADNVDPAVMAMLREWSLTS